MIIVLIKIFFILTTCIILFLYVMTDRPADCLSITCLDQLWSVAVKLQTSGLCLQG